MAQSQSVGNQSSNRCIYVAAGVAAAVCITAVVVGVLGHYHIGLCASFSTTTSYLSIGLGAAGLVIIPVAVGGVAIMQRRHQRARMLKELTSPDDAPHKEATPPPSQAASLQSFASHAHQPAGGPVVLPPPDHADEIPAAAAAPLRPVTPPIVEPAPPPVDKELTKLLRKKRDFEDSSYRDLGNTLECCYQAFIGRGGKVEGVAESITLRPGDRVYPVCTQGINRSQVIYLLLTRLQEEVLREAGIDVERPHGGGTAEDPYISIARNPNDAAEAMSYIRDAFDEEANKDPMNFAFTDPLNPTLYDPKKPVFGDPMNFAFRIVFGCPKSKRFAQETVEPYTEMVTLTITSPQGPQTTTEPVINAFATFSTPGSKREQAVLTTYRQKMVAARQAMAEHFNRHYFGQKVEEGRRRVFITFNRATHIIMERLLEAGGPLDNVTIISLDYADPVNTERTLVLAYEKMRRELGEKLRLQQADGSTVGLFEGAVWPKAPPDAGPPAGTR